MSAGFQFFLILLTILLAPPFAHAESTKVGRFHDWRACFQDQSCVKVGAESGYLGEGVFAGPSEWIVEVRDHKGKAVYKVSPGGEIVFISPTTSAKRNGGQKTFTIACKPDFWDQLAGLAEFLTDRSLVADPRLENVSAQSAPVWRST